MDDRAAHVPPVPAPVLGGGNPARCVECEEIELANVHDARPSQILPIPRMALAGFPEGRSPAALTRRRLLQFGAAGFASVYAPRVLGWESVWESAVADAAGSPPPKALVLLYLAGGQDGLNVIVPSSGTDYAAYVAKRPMIHRGQGPSTSGANALVGSTIVPGTGGNLAFANPLVSTAGGGDNGNATYGFDLLYGTTGGGGAGSDLALLPAVDYMPPNLSHFTSSDYWFAGDLNILATGWLGRYLDVYGSPTNPLQGISIGQSLSKALRPAAAPVCTISSLSSLGFRINPGYGGPGGAPSAVDPNAVIAQLAAAAATAGNTHLAHARQSYELATSVYTQTRTLGTPAFGTGYAPGNLGPQLQLAAFLLGAGLGTRVITIHWGSFDTHGNQLTQQDPQLKELSISLSAFLADLKARNIDDRVSVLMFSEFGRRVAENGSQGTDHGAGGLMMAAGTGVKGGFAAPFPGLASLDSNGDLMVPTDFRDVYAETISGWLGGDPAAILPKGTFSPITRYDGGSGLFN
jgi:uncharacterized protein (DUF1501 family)